MWLLFHRNAKTRPVRDGQTFVETCPECGQRARFCEVEISESFGMFFVNLVGDKERAFRCGACGETFDLKDRLPGGATTTPTLPAAPPAAPQRSAADVERARRAAEREQQAAADAKAIRIEDELAELKKRTGR